jgi:hypothetical protein
VGIVEAANCQLPEGYEMTLIMGRFVGQKGRRAEGRKGGKELGIKNKEQGIKKYLSGDRIF